MLKTIYDSESAVPDNLKGAYVEKDGKWTLDTLSDDHPVVKKKTELLGSVAEKTEKIEDLNDQITIAASKKLPAGHKAVKKEVAELGEAAVEAGLDKDGITKLKAENDRLTNEAKDRSYESTLEAAAKAIGITGVAAFKKLPASKALKLQEITENDEQKFVVITENNGKEVRTDFNLEWLEKNEDFEPFLPSLIAEASDDVDDTDKIKSKGATKFVKQSKTPVDKKNANEFDKIRENVKKQSEQKAPRAGTLSDRFHGRVSAAK